MLIEQEARLVKGQQSQLHGKEKALLNEYYKGEVYHYTTLPLLYSILKQNNLIASRSDNYYPRNNGYRQGSYNPKTGKLWDIICFTRDKAYNIRSGYGVNCRLVFDTDELMKIRNARLYPVNFSNQAKINNSNEAEERLYGVNITPLNKYVKRIDIFISNFATFGDGCTDLEDKLYDKYYDVFFEKHPNANNHEFYSYIGKKLLKSIITISEFKGKINIIYDKK